MGSVRRLWVDVGSGTLKADWRYVLVNYQNGRVDFGAEPRWDRGSDEEPPMIVHGFSHTVGPSGVTLTFQDEAGKEVTVTIPLDLFRNFQAMLARTASYLALKRWKVSRGAGERGPL